MIQSAPSVVVLSADCAHTLTQMVRAHVGRNPDTLLVDLSGLSRMDTADAAALAAARAEAMRGVPVELVITSSAVAKSVQLSDPDAQLCAWPSLADALRVGHDRIPRVTMNGIEVEALLFSHQFARNCFDMDVKRKLAEVRYLEQQQQKVVNWLLPGSASALETTIAYEQVAVDLTAWVARMEPDPYLKQAYQFGVLEDFDHLYRYANLYEIVQHRKAGKIVDGLTEVIPGRPTRYHHRHPVDNVREPYDKTTAAPISKLHAPTIMAASSRR